MHEEVSCRRFTRQDVRHELSKVGRGVPSLQNSEDKVVVVGWWWIFFPSHS